MGESWESLILQRTGVSFHDGKNMVFSAKKYGDHLIIPMHAMNVNFAMAPRCQTIWLSFHFVQSKMVLARYQVLEMYSNQPVSTCVL